MDKLLFNNVLELKPVFWENTKTLKANDAFLEIDVSKQDMIDAEERLQRFAPLIKKLFPETIDGIIESPLIEIRNMKNMIDKYYKSEIKGKFLLKCDSELKVAGSVKARGGIYEVLKHAEELAIQGGLIKHQDDYSVMANQEFRNFFSKYKIAVGSTGNLGLSIGIMSAALGFNVTVHMSRDAKQWKKDLLREKGVNVVEYNDDYSKAVEQGRRQCEKDKLAYFIDDENSKDLFVGYSTAALRLEKQLIDKNIVIDENHKLYVYLPCGVGGAPGGITFGLKQVFGDNVYCYFVEPTHSPCMLLGLITKKYNQIHVKDYGIDNITEADGLAVGSPSRLVSHVAEKLISGEYTIEDDNLFRLTALLKDSEDRKIEPSAAAGLLGPTLVTGDENCTHISWATGGLLLPEEIYKSNYERGKKLL